MMHQNRWSRFTIAPLYPATRKTTQPLWSQRCVLRHRTILISFANKTRVRVYVYT